MKVEQELKWFVQAIADAAPDPPLVDAAPHVQRRVSPVVALVGGFAAVLIIVGAGTGWILAGNPDPGAESATSIRVEIEIAPTPQEILADGVVTETEYRAAVGAVVACLEQQGITTTVRYGPSGVAGFNSTGEGAEALFDKCFGQHLGSVAYRWADQNYSPEQEVAFYNDVVDCVEAQTGKSYGDVRAGADTRATNAAIADAPDIYHTCIDRTIAFGRLTALVDAVNQSDPPAGMQMTASAIDQLTNEGTDEPLESALVATIKFNADSLGTGDITVVMTAITQWDPQDEIGHSGGTVSLQSVPGIGDALVDDDGSEISIAFSVPVAVLVTVVGRDVPMNMLEAFAAQLRGKLLEVPF